MVSLDKIRVGGKVWVQGGFGQERASLVTVIHTHQDIKNGRPGIDYELPNGDTRWAYLDQVRSLA